MLSLQTFNESGVTILRLDGEDLHMITSESLDNDKQVRWSAIGKLLQVAMVARHGMS